MCGLVGFLGGVAGVDGNEALLRRMTDTLIHRGHDDGGYWCDNEQRIGLGHRRLAIVDLSPAGHQPMVSASGRLVIAFNGEIYNHLDLRKQLGQICRSTSSSKEARVEWRGHLGTGTVVGGGEGWWLWVAPPQIQTRV